MAVIQGTRVKRSERLVFMEVETSSEVGGITKTFHRMQGFTELPESKEVSTYDRQYVDEETERSDVIGTKANLDFAMDYYKGHPVCEKVVDIMENEKTGADAIVTLMSVLIVGDTFTARKRDYSLSPSEIGPEIESLTYGGTFVSNGEIINGTATTTDDWMTAEFKESV